VRVFKSSYTDRKGKQTKTSKWYVEFNDHKGDVRRVPAFSSKGASEELGRNIDRLVAYTRATGGQIDPTLQNWVEELPRALLRKFLAIGLVKSERVSVSKTLTDHLDDYAAALAAKGNTSKHVKLSKKRIQRIFDGCGFRYWGDLSASKVQSFLSELREADEADGEDSVGISAATFNYYLGSIKAFSRWMVKDRRATSSPLSHLDILNVRMDRRHDRRALTEEELRRLIKATMDGRELSGWNIKRVVTWRLSGFDRSMLYRLAVETGLRVGEIRSLTPASFDFTSAVAIVKVSAAYSKHRRDDALPLLATTAAMLRDYVSKRPVNMPLFTLPKREAIAGVLRVDLEAAGIPYRDANNRVVDFHALRHTFITNLAQGGVHPKTAQTLARHSTITLTMDRYSHTGRDDEFRALSALPNLSQPSGNGDSPAAEQNHKTSPSVSADCLLERGRFRDTSVDSERLKSSPSTNSKTSTKHGRNRENQVAPVGFEPTLPDNGKRILSPLRLPFRHGADVASVAARLPWRCGLRRER
jgi:integrase